MESLFPPPSPPLLPLQFPSLPLYTSILLSIRLSPPGLFPPHLVALGNYYYYYYYCYEREGGGERREALYFSLRLPLAAARISVHHRDIGVHHHRLSTMIVGQISCQCSIIRHG